MNILERSVFAINGGEPVRQKPWLDNYTCDSSEINAVSRVINSGYLSLFEGSASPDIPFSFFGGPEVQGLETEWCEMFGCKHAISMNSATSGLFASIGALGLGYGDEIICSPYTMSACSVAPLIYGAIPVFADVEVETGCLDVSSIESKISPRTAAILVVHQFGFVADMAGIMQLAQKYNLKVIEDCAQAYGALYKGKHVGQFGHIGVFSLNVNKAIQSGEGGVCVTNDDELAQRLQLIRNHGEAVVEKLEYDNLVNMVGFNFRMTELTAAVAREQLKKLPRLLDHRLRLVRYLRDSLSKIEWLQIPTGREACRLCLCSAERKCHNSYYLFTSLFDASIAGFSRADFLKYLEAEGVLFAGGYVKPLYLQPLFQNKSAFKFGYPFTAEQNVQSNMEYTPGLCPRAEYLHFDSLVSSEYIRPPHTEYDIDQIVRAISKFVM